LKSRIATNNEINQMRYLLITSIPFGRQDGSLIIDGLWADDLRALAVAAGPLTVAAPEWKVEELKSWGPALATLTAQDQISFLSLPKYTDRFSLSKLIRSRKILYDAVVNADVVHSSNLFWPSTFLYYGHDVAIRLKRKTVFVVAEDFYDMQVWGWLRSESNLLKRWRARRIIVRQDRQVRKRVQSSSLTFLHTPAAVARYREYAANAVAIRQPMHEEKDVISLERFKAKCTSIQKNDPLILCAACRLEPLKGVDFMVRAISILKQRGISVRARFYGRGEQLASLKRIARRLEVEDQVKFPGSLAPGALREALAEGHLFLMPHLTTDFGRAFFDAMAAGIPVIAFRSLASEDTVRHQVDGLITPNADDEGLADGIARFHHDREMLVRTAIAARARALDNTKSFWNRYRLQMIQGLFDETAVE
jgi:glycosyltransferase involved in cell wall biosynthesis